MVFRDHILYFQLGYKTHRSAIQASQKPTSTIASVELFLASSQSLQPPPPPPRDHRSARHAKSRHQWWPLQSFSQTVASRCSRRRACAVTLALGQPKADFDNSVCKAIPSQQLVAVAADAATAAAVRSPQRYARQAKSQEPTSMVASVELVVHLSSLDQISTKYFFDIP